MKKFIDKYGLEYLQAEFDKKGWSIGKLESIKKMDVYCRNCGAELLPKSLQDQKISWPCWCNKSCKKEYNRKCLLSKPRRCRRCKNIFYAMAGRVCVSCTNALSLSDCKQCGIKFRYRKTTNAKKIHLKNIPLYCIECTENQSGNKDTIPELCVEGMLQQLSVGYVKQWSDHNVWDPELRRFRRFCADFYIPQTNCIIEADGDYWHGNDEKKLYDKRRDELFLSIGVPTYRFTEREIKSNPFDVEKKLKNILVE